MCGGLQRPEEGIKVPEHGVLRGQMLPLWVLGTELYFSGTAGSPPNSRVIFLAYIVCFKGKKKMNKINFNVAGEALKITITNK